MVKFVPLALMALAVSLFAAEPPSIDHIRSEPSPLNDIIVQHCWMRGGGEQIWLASADNFGC